MGLLRTLFAITVVLAHSAWNGGFVFVGGQNAVELFYMISGFLIFHIIRTNPVYQNVATFYLNRALRIFPIYYAVALLALVAHAIANPGFFELFHKIPVSADALLIGSNIFILGQDWVMFSGIAHGHLVASPNFRMSDVLLFKGLLVPQAWTLGLELTFYAMAPFIVGRNRVVLALLIFSILCKAGLLASGLGFFDPWTYRFFPAELLFFIVGGLSNQYLLPCFQRFVTTRDRHSWLPAAATWAFALASIFYFLIPGVDILKQEVLLGSFAMVLPLAFIYQNNVAWDKKIGDLSYPIYISHVLVIWVTETVSRKLSINSTMVLATVNVVGSIAFSVLLNAVVSEPIERLRKSVKASRRAVGAVNESS